jgi:hypothetical protein
MAEGVRHFKRGRARAVSAEEDRCARARAGSPPGAARVNRAGAAFRRGKVTA